MCFSKKEKQIPDDAPIVDRARPYLEHKKSLTDLDARKKADMEIVNFCLRSVPSMVTEFNLDHKDEMAILKKWITNDYSNYLICAKNGVTHIELLTLYVWKKTQATLSGNDGMSLISSFDSKMVIQYHYETKQGETISYFDKALGVPTSLVAVADLKLKLIDAQKLVEKIDVEIKYLDAVIISNFITATLCRIVRDEILSFISEHDATFYDLPHYYTAINQKILESLQATFESCGLEATDFALTDISVPNNTDKLLQNQFFAIAEAERIKAYEQRMEKASLDLYERKAEIHNKYPDFPLTLTETEKDLALNRYLKRMGQDTELRAEIQEKRIPQRVKEKGGTVTVAHTSSAPTFVETDKKFRLIFFIITAVLLIFSFSMFALSSVAGLATLGSSVLVCGLIAFFGYKKLKYGNQTVTKIEEEAAPIELTNDMAEPEIEPEVEKEDN